MKSFLFALVAMAGLAVVPQAQAHHGLAVRQAVVVRPAFRQRVVVAPFRQRVVVAPFRQQVIVGHHAQQFVAPVHVQQFVAPVYGVQQFVAPVQAGHCQQFFTR